MVCRWSQCRREQSGMVVMEVVIVVVVAAAAVVMIVAVGGTHISGGRRSSRERGYWDLRRSRWEEEKGRTDKLRKERKERKMTDPTRGDGDNCRAAATGRRGSKRQAP